MAVMPRGLLLCIRLDPLGVYSGHRYYREGGTNRHAPGMLSMAVVDTTPIWLTAWMLIAAVCRLSRTRGDSFLIG